MMMTTEHPTRWECQERQRQSRQQALDSGRTADQRNILGQYATPFPLAVEVAKAAVRLMPPDASLHFGEPSCGTGAFFSALMHLSLLERIASATGYEIDPAYADAGRDIWKDDHFHIVGQDFTSAVLQEQTVARPNLVLANPPYVRHHHFVGEKERLQRAAKQATGISVSGLAGLYVYFLLIAHEWLQEDGIASWLIPSEFMDVNYGEALKTYLTERVTLISLHRFAPDDMQFADALVSSAVVTFRKATPTQETSAAFTYGGSLEDPSVSEMITMQDLKKVHKWTSFPKRSGSRVRMKQTEGLLLGDLFSIKRGIATGANDFFILKRTEASHLGLEEAALRPVLPSPRHLKQERILVAPDGYPCIEPQLVMIDCNLPPSEVERTYPNLWKYLQTADEKGIHAGYLVSKRQPWYKQEQRPPALFLSTYMGRTAGGKKPFRFILNHSQAVATNLFLTLSPKEPLARLLYTDPDATETVFCLLNQIELDDLRDEGRVYGGGLHKIEPSELARVPAASFAERLPELSASAPRQLAFVMEKKTRGYSP